MILAVELNVKTPILIFVKTHLKPTILACGCERGDNSEWGNLNASPTLSVKLARYFLMSDLLTVRNLNQ